jgi:sporulation protein YlmC with PRC-barrel domain
VRQILDNPVVDRHGQQMGRVDGLTIVQRQGEPPRLSELLMGPSALGYRLHPIAGRWIAALEKALGIDRNGPIRVDFEHVIAIADNVTIDQTVGEAGAGVVEHRLRAWLAKIPGGK